MTIKLGIPALSYHDIRIRAQEFLRAYPERAGIPIDIEGLIDTDLRIHILCLPGLRMLCGTDAYISSDFARVAVDELVCDHYENRFRFSLAHELGHLVLHRPFFALVVITDVVEYRRFQDELDPYEYSLMQDQANDFAGLFLVPSVELAERFQAAKSKAARRGVSLAENWDRAIDYVANDLGKAFGVAPKTAKIRLAKDGLIPRRRF